MGKQSISIYKANVINLQIPLNKSTLGRLLFFKCNRQGRDGGWGGGGIHPVLPLFREKLG